MPEIPEGATVPADHQPKQTKAKKAAEKKAAANAAVAEATGEQISIEYDGGTYTMVTNFDGDVEMLEDVAELGDGDLTVLPRIIRRIIGRAAYVEFKEKYRDAETGVVPTTPLLDLWELMNASLGE